jgi:hypothetical protein
MGASSVFTIQIVNRTTISKSELVTVVAALNQQLLKHFFPAWNVRLVCKIAPMKIELRDVTQGAVIFLIDRRNQEYQGYHDVVRRTGVPYGYCFVDLLDDEPWSVTLSHEVLELALNPTTYGYELSKHPDKREKRMVFVWREPCDAVQCQSYVIKVNRKPVMVSDFVYPHYFTPYSEVNGQNNHLDNVATCGLTEGGYVGYYDPLTGNDENFFAEDDRKAMTRFDLKTKSGKYRRRARAAELLRSIKSKPGA